MVNGLKHDRYSAAVKVAVKGLELGAGFDRQENTGVDVVRLQQGYGMGLDSQGGAATTFTKVVAGYHFPFGTYVGAGLERASYGFASYTPVGSLQYLPKGTMHQDGVMLSLAQSIGHATLMASYAKLGSLSDAVFAEGSDYEGSQYSLGARWDFTEVFAVYAYYTEIKNHPQQTLDLGQAPLFSVDNGTSTAVLSAGTSPSAFGLGGIVRF
jgi:hypothetical protein